MDPVCSTARLTTLILRPSQKRVKVLLGGGAAEKLPKMGQQPEASPARTVMLYGSALTVVGVALYVCPSKCTVSLYCRPAHAQHCCIQACCTTVAMYAQQLLISCFLIKRFVLNPAWSCVQQRSRKLLLPCWTYGHIAFAKP